MTLLQEPIRMVPVVNTTTSPVLTLHEHSLLLAQMGTEHTICED